jgi:hypothetical protein
MLPIYADLSGRHSSTSQRRTTSGSSRRWRPTFECLGPRAEVTVYFHDAEE